MLIRLKKYLFDDHKLIAHGKNCRYNELDLRASLNFVLHF